MRKAGNMSDIGSFGEHFVNAVAIGLKIAPEVFQQDKRAFPATAFTIIEK
jgi:hypothetical protein